MEVYYTPSEWKPTEEFYDAVEYGIHALCLEEIPGELTIELLSGYSDALGDSYFDGVDEYTIRLSRADIPTLFHELVHVMQYANYELEVYKEGHAFWKDSTVEGLTYEESPWEIEAFHMEQVLERCFRLHRQESS